MAWDGLDPLSSSLASDAERKRQARSDRGAGLTPSSRFMEPGYADTPPPFCIDTAPGMLVLALMVSRAAGPVAEAAGVCPILQNDNRLPELDELGVWPLRSALSQNHVLALGPLGA